MLPDAAVGEGSPRNSFTLPALALAADTLRRLAEAGVDAVYTRRPDIAHEVFAKLTGS